MASSVALDELIVMTPTVRRGKPRIAGRRIAVQDVAVWHERMGWSVDRIADEFDLSLAEVHAALAYYFIHREEIDRAIREGQEKAEAIRQATSSLTKQRQRDEQP